MNISRTYKAYNSIQKTGIIIISIVSAKTLFKIFNILEASHFIEEDLPGNIFLLGALLLLLSFISKRIISGKTANKATVFVVTLCTTFAITAQDYSKQIKAFEQSFSKKSVVPLQEYISPNLKFDPIPVKNTLVILNNIVTNLPKLNAMRILESSEGKAKIKYDFVDLGIRESYMYFDTDGRFTRIELIENLIKQEIEAQKKLKESVQLPNPGTLGKKYQPKQVTLTSADGLSVHANLYHIEKHKPVILLCHQAGYNRLEYADIAPKLNEMGYNCLAVDLRSGGNFAEKTNITAERAKNDGLKNQMVDSQQDIKAAIAFLTKEYNQKVIVWGSSYSSSLALLEAVSNNNINAVIAFSPGNYFGEDALSLSTVFKKTNTPFLVTSSKKEAPSLTSLIGAIKLNKKQSQFIPQSEGFHGSKAVWTGQKGAVEYWEAIITFLNKI
ncbi:dienelactone hydrolase family protein [Aquimarina sp. M1]